MYSFRRFIESGAVTPEVIWDILERWADVGSMAGADTGGLQSNLLTMVLGSPAMMRQIDSDENLLKLLQFIDSVSRLSGQASYNWRKLHAAFGKFLTENKNRIREAVIRWIDEDEARTDELKNTFLTNELNDYPGGIILEGRDAMEDLRILLSLGYFMRQFVTEQIQRVSGGATTFELVITALLNKLEREHPGLTDEQKLIMYEMILEKLEEESLNAQWTDSIYKGYLDIYNRLGRVSTRLIKTKLESRGIHLAGDANPFVTRLIYLYSLGGVLSPEALRQIFLRNRYNENDWLAFFGYVNGKKKHVMRRFSLKDDTKQNRLWASFFTPMGLNALWMRLGVAGQLSPDDQFKTPEHAAKWTSSGYVPFFGEFHVFLGRIDGMAELFNAAALARSDEREGVSRLDAANSIGALLELFDYIETYRGGFDELLSEITRFLPPSIYRNFALYTLFVHKVLTPLFARHGRYIERERTLDFEYIENEINSLNEEEISEIGAAITRITPFLSMDLDVQNRNQALMASVASDEVPENFPINRYENERNTYEDILFHTPGGPLAQLRIFLPLANRVYLEDFVRRSDKDFGDKLAEILAYFPGKASATRDEFLKTLLDNHKCTAENIDSTVALFANPHLREQYALRALEMERKLYPERFAVLFVLDKDGNIDQNSTKGELNRIVHYFPTFSYSRDDILLSAQDRAVEPGDIAVINKLLLQHPDNIRNKEQAEFSYYKDLIRIIIGSREANEKAEFLLWLLGITDRRPLFIMNFEYRFKVNLEPLRDIFAAESGEYYKDVGDSARDDFLSNFLHGDSGILTEQSTATGFLNALFDAVLPGQRDSILKLIYDNVFRIRDTDTLTDKLRREEIILNLIKGFSKLRSDEELTQKGKETEIIRIFLESLGVVGVKLGQALGYEKLKDSAGAVHKGITFDMINKLFGDFYAKFRDLLNLLGSASIKTVYRARLKDGRIAVVKVKRPEVEKRVREDIAFLSTVLDDVRDNLREKGFTVPARLVDRIKEMINEELDFTLEGRNQRRLAFNLATRGRLWGGLLRFFLYRRFQKSGEDYLLPQNRVYRFHVPNSTELANNTLMIEEFADGVSLKNERALRQAGFDPQDLRNAVANELLRQIFIDGFYHADPHSGNILLLPDGTIVFIDLGSCAAISIENRRRLLSLYNGIQNNDIDMIISVIQTISPVSGKLKSEIYEEVICSRNSPVKKVLRLFHILEKNNIDMPDELMSIGRFLGSAGYLFDTFVNAWQKGTPAFILQEHLDVLQDKAMGKKFRVPEVMLVSRETMNSVAAGHNVIRQGNQVLVEEGHWNSLSDLQKLNLLMHEGMADWMERERPELEAEDIAMFVEAKMEDWETRRKAHIGLKVDVSMEGGSITETGVEAKGYRHVPVTPSVPTDIEPGILTPGELGGVWVSKEENPVARNRKEKIRNALRYVTQSEFESALKEVADSLNAELDKTQSYGVVFDTFAHKSKRWVYELARQRGYLKKEPAATAYANTGFDRTMGSDKLGSRPTIVIFDDMAISGEQINMICSNIIAKAYPNGADIMIAVPYMTEKAKDFLERVLPEALNRGRKPDNKFTIKIFLSSKGIITPIGKELADELNKGLDNATEKFLEDEILFYFEHGVPDSFSLFPPGIKRVLIGAKPEEVLPDKKPYNKSNAYYDWEERLYDEQTAPSAEGPAETVPYAVTVPVEEAGVPANLIGALYNNPGREGLPVSDIVTRIDGKRIYLNSKDGSELYDKNGNKVDFIEFGEKVHDEIKEAIIGEIENNIDNLSGEDRDNAESILEYLRTHDVYMLLDNRHGIMGMPGVIDKKLFINKKLLLDVGLFHEAGEAFFAANPDRLPGGLNAHTYLRGAGTAERISNPQGFRRGLQDKLFGADRNNGFSVSVAKINIDNALSIGDFERARKISAKTIDTSTVLSIYGKGMVRLTIDQAEQEFKKSQLRKKAQEERINRIQKIREKLAKEGPLSFLSPLLGKGKIPSLQEIVAAIWELADPAMIISSEIKNLRLAKKGVVAGKSVLDRYIGNGVMGELYLKNGKIVHFLIYYNGDGALEKIYIRAHKKTEDDGPYMGIDPLGMKFVCISNEELIDDAREGMLDENKRAVIRAINTRIRQAASSYDAIEASLIDNDGSYEIQRPVVHDKFSRDHILDVISNYPGIEYLLEFMDKIHFPIPEDMLFVRNLKHPASRGMSGGTYFNGMIFTHDKIFITTTFIHEITHALFDYLVDVIGVNEDGSLRRIYFRDDELLLERELYFGIRKYFMNSHFHGQLRRERLYRMHYNTDGSIRNQYGAITEAFAYTMQAILSLRGYALDTWATVMDVEFLVNMKILPSYFLPEELYPDIDKMRDESLTNENYYFPLVACLYKRGERYIAESLANRIIGFNYKEATEFLKFLADRNDTVTFGAFFDIFMNDETFETARIERISCAEMRENLFEIFNLCQKLEMFDRGSVAWALFEMEARKSPHTVIGLMSLHNELELNEKLLTIFIENAKEWEFERVKSEIRKKYVDAVAAGDNGQAAFYHDVYEAIANRDTAFLVPMAEVVAISARGSAMATALVILTGGAGLGLGLVIISPLLIGIMGAILLSSLPLIWQTITSYRIAGYRGTAASPAGTPADVWKRTLAGFGIFIGPLAVIHELTHKLTARFGIAKPGGFTDELIAYTAECISILFLPLTVVVTHLLFTALISAGRGATDKGQLPLLRSEKAELITLREGDAVVSKSGTKREILHIDEEADEAVVRRLPVYGSPSIRRMKISDLIKGIEQGKAERYVDVELRARELLMRFNGELPLIVMPSSGHLEDSVQMSLGLIEFFREKGISSYSPEANKIVEKARELEREAKKAKGSDIPAIEDNSAYGHFRRLLAQGVPVRLYAEKEGDESEIELSSEVLRGYNPAYEIEYGNDTYFLSRPFITSGGRIAYIAYVYHRPHDGSEPKLYVTGYYESNSHAVWRAVSHTSEMEDGGLWYGKGLEQDKQALPIEIQDKLDKITANHSGLWVDKDIFVKALAKGGIMADASVLDTQLYLEKEAFRNGDKIPIAEEELDTDGWVTGYRFTKGYKPDYSTLRKLYESRNNLYGRVRHYVVSSENGEVQYLVNIDERNRVWIGSLQSTEKRIDRQGCRLGRARFNVPESMLIPAEDYIMEAWRYMRPADIIRIKPNSADNRYGDVSAFHRRIGFFEELKGVIVNFEAREAPTENFEKPEGDIVAGYAGEANIGKAFNLASADLLIPADEISFGPGENYKVKNGKVRLGDVEVEVKIWGGKGKILDAGGGEIDDDGIVVKTEDGKFHIIIRAGPMEAMKKNLLHEFVAFLELAGGVAVTRETAPLHEMANGPLGYDTPKDETLPEHTLNRLLQDIPMGQGVIVAAFGNLPDKPAGPEAYLDGRDKRRAGEPVTGETTEFPSEFEADGLRESGMPEEEAIWYESVLKSAWEENDTEKIKQVKNYMRDRYRFGKLEVIFEEIIGRVLNRTLRLPETQDRSLDISKLLDKESVDAIKKEFLDELEALEENGIYVSTKFKELILVFIDKAPLDGFVAKNKNHLRIADLIMILQRLHTIAVSSLEFTATVDIVSERFKNNLYGLVVQIRPSNAVLFHILTRAGLAGGSWEATPLNERVRDALNKGDFVGAIRRIAVTRKVVAGGELQQDIKAFCEHFGIEPALMEHNFIMHEVSKIENGGKGNFIELLASEDFNRLVGSVLEHFTYSGIIRILNASRLLPEYGVKIEKFVYRGFDGIVFTGVYEGEKVIVKINVPQNGRMSDTLERLLNSLSEKLRRKPAGSAHFARSKKIFSVSLMRGKKDVIEVSEYAEGMTLKEFLGRYGIRRLTLPRLLGIVIQVMETGLFLKELGYTDTEAHVLANYVITNDGKDMVRLVDFGHVFELRDEDLTRNKTNQIVTAVAILCGHKWSSATTEKVKVSAAAFLKRFEGKDRELAESIFNILEKALRDTENTDLTGPINELKAIRDRMERPVIALGSISHDAEIFNIAEKPMLIQSATGMLYGTEVWDKLQGIVGNVISLNEDGDAEITDTIYGLFFRLDEIVKAIVLASREHRLSVSMASEYIAEYKNIVNDLREKRGAIAKIAEETPSHADKIGIILSNLDSAIEMLQNIFDFTEDNVIMHQVNTKELRDIIEEALSAEKNRYEKVDYVRPKIEVKIVEPESPFPDNTRVPVNDLYLKAVIFNLVKNAVDHAEKGPVEVRIGLVEAGGRHCIRIDVADDGDGIEERDMENIFKLHTSFRPGGTGFGLPLVRLAVSDIKGARIEVSSKPKSAYPEGHSTDFSLYLPASYGEKKEAMPPAFSETAVKEKPQGPSPAEVAPLAVEKSYGEPTAQAELGEAPEMELPALVSGPAEETMPIIEEARAVRNGARRDTVDILGLPGSPKIEDQNGHASVEKEIKKELTKLGELSGNALVVDHYGCGSRESLRKMLLRNTRLLMEAITREEREKGRVAARHLSYVTKEDMDYAKNEISVIAREVAGEENASLAEELIKRTDFIALDGMPENGLLFDAYFVIGGQGVLDIRRYGTDYEKLDADKMRQREMRVISLFENIFTDINKLGDNPHSILIALLGGQSVRIKKIVFESIREYYERNREVIQAI
ncbi:MAG: hypothetical protein JW994_06440 [Candidatus Omnitrophica bacterium]|nr:hypothetical protein [Candidatus Omnitrophota bacterium]